MTNLDETSDWAGQLWAPICRAKPATWAEMGERILAHFDVAIDIEDALAERE